MSKAHGNKLTAKQQEELKALQAMADSDIDYTDIPPAHPGDWQGAEVGRFYKPVKQQLTIRLDEDIVDFFQASGKGYQTRINDLLRQAMMKEAKH